MSITSTRELIPVNTKNARENAVRSFQKFVAKGTISFEEVCTRISKDKSGKTFIKVMDVYGISLLHSDDNSKQLAKNTVLQYFGNVKNWYFDAYPFLVAVSQRELIGISHRLEKFASKRHDGTIVKKAPALTSSDLKSIVQILYRNATSDVDYTDAGLLAIMWYFFWEKLGHAYDEEGTDTSSTRWCNVFYFWSHEDFAYPRSFVLQAQIRFLVMSCAFFGRRNGNARGAHAIHCQVRRYSI